MALNHYLLLGIPPDADQQRIKAAFRSLAKRFHPDANQGSETATELFRQINEAYRVLSNPEARRKYDQKLKAGQPGSPSPSGSAANRFTSAAPEDKFNRFLNSLLDALFGPPERSPPRADCAEQASPRTKEAPRKRRKPAFSFYFHLAMEQQKASYQRGEDGIFRAAPKRPAPCGGGKGGMPRGMLLVLLTALLSWLQV